SGRHDIARSSRGRGSVLIGAGIFLSRASGLVRERVVGHFFGTGHAADAFSAAYRIPNVLQSLLGEGVLSASIVPMYSRLLADGREEDAGRVAGALAGLLAAVVGATVVLVVVFARSVVAVLAPGLAPETFDLTVVLLQIIAPGVGFLVLSAWCLGILNSHRRFFLSYVAPVLMNVVQIAVLIGATTVVVGGGVGGGLSGLEQSSLVVWLAWGVVIGGFLQFAVQLPTVFRLTPHLRLSLRTRDAGVREAVRSFVPLVAGKGVVHLSGYVQLVLASFLAVGALAGLRYAQMLYVLPVSLFAMSVAAAELPVLSTIGAERLGELRDRVKSGLGLIAFLVAPTVVAYVVIGDLVVAALLQTGEFGRADTVQVWMILAVHAVGLPATTGSRLLQSALYGLGKPRNAARIAIVRVAVALALGALLMFSFDRVVVGPEGLSVVGDVPAFMPLPADVRNSVPVEEQKHLGAVGLALAAGAASLLEYRLLRRALLRQGVRIAMTTGHILRTAVAAGISGIAAGAVRFVVGDLTPVVAGAAAVVVTAMVYLAASWRLGVPESRQFVGLLVRRRATGGAGHS
ncbi:MAG TPA: murein biosynthesis integral membrane protein MurJ, partial [Acidimicrobiales bacterium]|nr:murein biosynthesis integral membrane protein MurJ [Acidimicrobiales bacterium]